MVLESDGWSARMVPESDWCRKTRLEVLEGYRKATLGVMVGSHDRRSLQIFKSCISFQLFEITNGRQKDELNQA